MKIEILRTPEFDLWLEEQTLKTKFIVQARLKRLSEEGHWGFINRFDGLIELKWASGLRIYTAPSGSVQVVVLLGGNKNGQSKDIQKAKKLLARYFD